MKLVFRVLSMLWYRVITLFGWPMPPSEVDTWPQWKREALGVVKALNGAQSLPAEYSAAVDRRFWELIGDSDNDEV